MTDEERLNWLEKQHTLHRAVEFLYVVDGYLAQMTHDGEPIGEESHGETLREALDKLASRTQ